MGRAFIDITNQRFGNLVAVSYAGKDNSKDHYRLWSCQCDCKNIKVIAYRSLVSGKTISCGCIGRSNLTGGGLNKLGEGVARFNDLFLLYQKSAEKRNREFSLTREQFRLLTQSDCYYCGQPPSQRIRAGKECNGDYVYNGVDRVDNTLGYILSNVRPCCKQCNIAKNTMTEQSFYLWLHQISAHLIKNTP